MGPGQPHRRLRQGRGRGATARAEDEESRRAGATFKEAEARSRTGSHCLGRRCGIKTTGRAGVTSQEAEDGQPLPGPEMSNQDHWNGEG